MIQIQIGLNPPRRIKRIMTPPRTSTPKYPPPHLPIPWVLPPLNTPAINMRPQRKLGIPRLADPESVKVGYGGIEAYGGVGVGCTPEGEEEAVGGEDGGMGACLDLGFGVVDFEDLDVFWGVSWVECCLNNGGTRGGEGIMRTLDTTSICRCVVFDFLVPAKRFLLPPIDQDYHQEGGRITKRTSLGTPPVITTVPTFLILEICSVDSPFSLSP